MTVPSDDEPVARTLRAALAREADVVRPSEDGLDRIMGELATDEEPAAARPPRRTGPPGWVPWVAGVAAAAVIGVVAALVFTGGADRTAPPVASPSPSTTAPSPEPTSEPDPTTTPSDPPPEPTTPPPAGQLDQVPVYWTQQYPSGVYLYREFRSVPDSGGVVASALRAMMTQTPLDDDLGTVWRQPTSLAVSQEGDAIAVDVSADAFANTQVGSEAAAAAVQQLVWTATAAAQSPGPVTVLVDGAPYDAWGTVGLGEPMTREPDARGSIWIDTPVEAAAVAPGVLAVEGTSTAFEATVNWEVTDAAGTPVADGFTQGGANGEFGPYSFTADLTDRPAGTYTVSVWADDVSAGEAPDGPRLGLQTRQVQLG